jgi:DNA-binding LacI/PurR family transcriptional regulator
MDNIFVQGLGKESERVMRTLRDGIVKGCYPPGTRIPSERALCTQFALSRTTVRRAISRLSADGWITVRHGSGLYVNALPYANPTKSKSISVMFSMNADLLARVQEHALLNGYLVSAFPRQEMGWAPAAERSFLEHIRQERHHALLAFCTPLEPHNDDLLEQMEREGMRIIHVEHYREQEPRQSFILPDYRAAGQLAVQSCLKAGYRQVLAVRMKNDWPGALIMQQGLSDELIRLTSNTVPDPPIFIYPVGVPQHEQKAAEVRAFLSQLAPLTALLCSNVSIASETLAIARTMGIDCPGKLGVIGMPYLDYHVPTEGIDTIEFDRQGYLLSAMDHVMAPRWGHGREWVPPLFIPRGTTRLPLSEPCQRLQEIPDAN